MATKIDFKTILMKLVNIFPKDMYLVHNWCAIAGIESDNENRGFYFCILEPDVRECLTKAFPNNPILYIKSVRETKSDITKVEEVLNNEDIKVIESIINRYTKELNEVSEWSTFDFTEDDISSLFNDGQSLTLFENEENRSPIIISKTLFPLITEKTINTVKYSYTKYEADDNLDKLIMVYDYELFQLVMKYLYIKL